MVWKLFHINEEIERCSTNIEQANSKLKGLKSAQVREQALKSIIEQSFVLIRFLGAQTDEEKKLKKAKDAQAKANLAVKKQETIVKTAERALEDKVNSLVPCTEITRWLTVAALFAPSQKKPRLLTLETQIEHANRKIESTSKLITSVEKDEARQQTTVTNLKRDLRDTEEAAEDAAGQLCDSVDVR
jgi:DNA primase catalytic subunit